jgi:drug/metabolite transporter (DMT)-like permease
VFFATLPIALKFLLRDMSTSSVAMLRVFGAAALFLVLQRLVSREQVTSLADHGRLALYALFGVVLNQVLYINAVEFTTAAAAQTMMAAGPAITLLIAILAGAEKASLGKWAGIALAGAGALALVGVGLRSGGALGNFLALLNVTAYSVYLVISRDLAKRYQPITVISWVFVYGTIGVFPWGIGPSLEEATGAPLHAWLLLAYIILVPTVGAYYLNVYALRHLDSSVVGVFIYIQPPITAVLAHLLLDERVSAQMIPAALLILAGVSVAALAARRARIRAAAPPSAAGP